MSGVDAFCEECRKVVKVKRVHFAGFNCNVHLKCGHHIHFSFLRRMDEAKGTWEKAEAGG